MDSPWRRVRGGAAAAIFRGDESLTTWTFRSRDLGGRLRYEPDAEDETRPKKRWQRVRLRAFESGGEAVVRFLRTMADYPPDDEDVVDPGAGGALTAEKLIAHLLAVAMRETGGGVFGDFGGVPPADVVAPPRPIVAAP